MATITIPDDLGAAVRADKINPFQAVKISDARKAAAKATRKVERLQEQLETAQEELDAHQQVLDELEPLLTADESQDHEAGDEAE